MRLDFEDADVIQLEGRELTPSKAVAEDGSHLRTIAREAVADIEEKFADRLEINRDLSRSVNRPAIMTPVLG